MCALVAGDRATLVRSLSVPAAEKFADNFFDWVYIDALHTEDALYNDLVAWWPKVRNGGLVSGDDYGTHLKDTPLMSVKRWWNEFGKPITHKSLDEYKKIAGWGVISATQRFAKEQSVPLFVTYSKGCYPYPAWYLVKP